MTRFFSERAVSRWSKACLYKVSRKKSKNWLRRTNIKSTLTPNIEYILKPSNYNAKTWFLHLTAQKSKCPRRFWELDPGILHVFNVPLPSLSRMFFFFRRKCGVSSDTNIPRKNENRNIWRKEKKQKHPLQAWQGHTKHTCKISGSNSQKRRGHWHLKELWFYAWTSLYTP